MNKTGFCQDILSLRKEIKTQLSMADKHALNSIILVNTVFFLVGTSLAFWYPNPITMVCWSLWLTNRWCIVAHHVLHGGYDTIVKADSRFHSNTFAKGWRRWIDWSDWIYPPAWKYEHNNLHHYYTNENLDPDCVVNNANISQNKSTLTRHLLLFTFICTWKPFYYALNTLKAYHEKKEFDHTGNPKAYLKHGIIACYLPYITIHFILFPLLFLPFGLQAAGFVLINRIGAEILTNIHTFMIIVPNHTASDLTLHSDHFDSKEEFFYRQVVSSCNYRTRNPIIDYLSGYLNYQIEHHLFPNLPASQYPKIQPRVKALCEKHQIPYKEESVFIRARKTITHILAM